MPICTIPFTGFYYSSHDQALDQALESVCSDENGDIIDARMEAASDAINWHKAHIAYATLYASALADECAAIWQFVKLDSPREYNFRSDEIDVSIEPCELQRIYDETDKQALAALVAKRLKARSGFIPFYSDDLSDWGDLSDWEAPQLSLLIECYCNAYCNADERAWNLLDDSNGELTAIIEQALPQETLATLYG